MRSVTDPDGKTVSYSYDVVRRRTTMVDPDGGVTSYSYDDADRLTAVTNPRGQTTALAYDLAGRRVRLEHGNGAITSYSYDCADRLRTLTHTASDDTLLKAFTYSYDQAGNRRGVVESTGAVTTWSYDKTYQLLREERSAAPAYSTSYTYDAAGNRLTANDSGAVTSYTYDEANRLVTEENSSGVTTYSYDEDGNRTEKETPSELTVYTWDEDSRLVVAEPVAGLVTLTYRADGRRVQKETPSESKHFIYDLNRLLQETDDAGDPLHEYSSTLAEWGDLISEYDGTDTLYHQYDALGSTDALLDDSETATASYAHRAFGLEAAHSGTAESSFTFVGAQNYYRDPELELYFAGARYYDPAAGRWVSADPIGFAAGDENLFRYVGNNPVNKVDASGMESLDEKRERVKAELVRALKRFGSAEVRSEFLEGMADGFLDGLKDWIRLYGLSEDLRVSAMGYTLDALTYLPVVPGLTPSLANAFEEHCAEPARERLVDAASELMESSLSATQALRAIPEMIRLGSAILGFLKKTRISFGHPGLVTSLCTPPSAFRAEKALDLIDDPVLLDFIEFVLGIQPRQHGFLAGMLLYELAESAVVAVVTAGAGAILKLKIVRKFINAVRKSPRFAGIAKQLDRLEDFAAVTKARGFEGVRSRPDHFTQGIREGEAAVDAQRATVRIGDEALAPQSVHYDVGRVPGPNPNNLRQRVVTAPTAGEGGVYLKPQSGRTKIGSTNDFRGRYGATAPDGIEVEIPLTRTGPAADDSAYRWTARRQRRFDEEYLDRITPPDVRYRDPSNPKSPVDPAKWEQYRHIFGYGDLPADFGS